MIVRHDFQKIREWMLGSANISAPLITIRDPTVVETLLNASPDMLIVDLEHSVIDTADLQSMVMAAGNVPLLARIRGLEKNEIKRVLDTGAAGIIVPGIESAEDAAKSVQWARFYPEGSRGVGPGRASGFGYSFAQYSKQSPLVFVQIETPQALRDVERISEVKGLDGLFIGPVDLSTSLGIEFSWNNHDFVSAVDTIRGAARNRGLVVAIYSPLNEALLAEVRRRNFNFVMLGMDREAILQTYTRFIKK